MDVRAIRCGLSIDFSTLRNLVMICSNSISGSEFVVISGYDGLSFEFKLEASIPLFRRSGGAVGVGIG